MNWSINNGKHQTGLIVERHCCHPLIRPVISHAVVVQLLTYADVKMQEIVLLTIFRFNYSKMGKFIESMSVIQMEILISSEDSISIRHEEWRGYGATELNYGMLDGREAKHNWKWIPIQYAQLGHGERRWFNVDETPQKIPSVSKLHTLISIFIFLLISFDIFEICNKQKFHSAPSFDVCVRVCVWYNEAMKLSLIDT